VFSLRPEKAGVDSSILSLGTTHLVTLPWGTLWLVVMLCVCVLVQMFGLPVTMLSLFTTSDMLTGSICGDPLVLPLAPELRPSNALRLCTVGHPIPYLPVLATSVFHPPLT
jgi:hypothetical protein